jgi:hypothetical protein
MSGVEALSSAKRIESNAGRRQASATGSHACSPTASLSSLSIYLCPELVVRDSAIVLHKSDTAHRVRVDIHEENE